MAFQQSAFQSNAFQTPSRAFGQTQTFIYGQFYKSAQARVFIPGEGKYGQAQATILKLAGYGQTTAYIIFYRIDTLFLDTFSRTTTAPPFAVGTADSGTSWNWSDWDTTVTSAADSTLYVDGSALILPVPAGQVYDSLRNAAATMEDGEFFIDFWMPAAGDQGLITYWYDRKWYFGIDGLDDNNIYLVGTVGAVSVPTNGRSAWYRFRAIVNSTTSPYVKAHIWKIGDTEPVTYTDLQLAWPYDGLGVNYNPGLLDIYYTPTSEAAKFDNIKLTSSIAVYINAGSGNAAARIHRFEGYAITQATIKAFDVNNFGQTQAFIRKSAGYGQAQTRIALSSAVDFYGYTTQQHGAGSYYPLNTNANADAGIDVIGNQNLTVTTGYSQITGINPQPRQALAPTSVGSRLTTTAPARFLGTQWSVDGWIKFPSITSRAPLFGFVLNGTGQYISVGLGGSTSGSQGTSIRVFHYFSSATHVYTASGTFTNQLAYIALTYDSGIYTLFVNGIQELSWSGIADIVTAFYINYDPFYGSPTAPIQFVDGVAAYDILLTPAQIEDHYIAGKLQSYGYALAFIKRTIDYGQANAQIASIIKNVYGQAHFDMVRRGSKGQAQARIKITVTTYGQAQAFTNTTVRAFGQTNALIFKAGFGQAQAFIGAFFTSQFGQAQVFIPGQYFRNGQAQVSVRRIVVTQTGTSTALSLGFTAVSGRLVVAVVSFRTSGVVTYTPSGIWQLIDSSTGDQPTFIIAGFAAGGETSVGGTFSTYPAHGTVSVEVTNVTLNEVISSLNYGGSGSPHVGGIVSPVSNRPAFIFGGFSATSFEPLYSAATSGYTFVGSVIAGAGDNPVLGGVYQIVDSTTGTYQAGITGRSINAYKGFTVLFYQREYLGYGLTQARILRAYTTYGQANTFIAGQYFANGQALAKITAQYTSQLGIFLSIPANNLLPGFGAIFSTTVSGQATFRSRRTELAIGQAQITIKQTYSAFGQTNVYIGWARWGQAQASIKATSNKFGQAQTVLPATYASYNAAVAAHNPTGHWILNDASGTVAVAQIGPNGTYKASGITYQINAPMAANSQSKGITATPSTYMITNAGDVTNDFAYEVWYRTTTSIALPGESTSGIYGGSTSNASGGGGAPNNLWFPDNRGGNRGSGVSVGTNGIVVEAHGNSTLCAPAVYSGTISTGWHHLVINVISRTSYIYLDGVLVRTGLQIAETYYRPLDLLGEDSYGPFQGSVNNAALYPASLTPNAIEDHYRMGVPRGYGQARVRVGLSQGYGYTTGLIDSPIKQAKGQAQLSIKAPSPAQAQALIAVASVIWYKLDETSGSFLDVYGANDLTVTGSPTYNVGGYKAGSQAITFVSSAYGSKALPTAALPTGSAARSYEVWFKSTNTGRSVLISHGTNSTRQAFNVSLNHDTANQLGYWAWSDDTYFTASNTADGKWHHVILTYASAATQIKVYYDGALIGTGSLGGALNTASGTTLYLANSVIFGEVFTGTLDEAKIYNFELNAAQILDKYGSRIIGFGQALVFIGNPVVHGQTQALINYIALGYGQTLATIKAFDVNTYGQAQTHVVLINLNRYGQSNTFIRKSAGYGQAQAYILTTIAKVGQALAFIGHIQTSQAQAYLRAFDVNVSGQAQTKLRAYDVNSYGQAQLRINSPLRVGQAQARVTALARNHGQALAFVGHLQYGQAQAKLNSFGYPQWGQANSDIVTTYRKFGQAQAAIDHAGHGNTQARILQIYRVYGNAFSYILPPTFWGQAQARIIGFNINRYAQAQARILQIYNSYAQARVLTTKPRGLAQATVLIKAVRGKGYGNVLAFIGHIPAGQAQAIITKPFAFAHTQADIKVKVRIYGQARVFVEGWKYSSQALALIVKTDIIFTGQAQTIIDQSMYVGQAQADILQVYNKHAQVLARIKQTYRPVAQAQTHIRHRERFSGQAQARVVGTKRVYGQAQAIIGGFRYSQAQARIIVFGVPRIGQAMGYILVNVTVTPPNPTSGATSYLVRFAGNTLPGYAQSEAQHSVESMFSHPTLPEYLGLQNKLIDLVMKVWEPTYSEAKQQIELAATILRAGKGFQKLYINSPDAYYLAILQKISFDKAVRSSMRQIDYVVNLEAKPWAISNALYEVAGTGTVTTTNRTLLDGTWTPTRVLLSGTNIVITGINDDGRDTGTIQLNGIVSNLIVDTEAHTATENSVDKRGLIVNKDFALYVGPGVTTFTITGATSARIQYNNRWLLFKGKGASLQTVTTDPI